MIIATRALLFRDEDAEQEIQISIHAPEKTTSHWICRYEINWPEGVWASEGAGVDAIQAIHLTLKKIGAEIYASASHQSGKLRWRTAGRGYGFPVPSNARDLLEGDDKIFEA